MRETEGTYLLRRPYTHPSLRPSRTSLSGKREKEGTELKGRRETSETLGRHMPESQIAANTASDIYVATRVSLLPSFPHHARQRYVAAHSNRPRRR